MRLHEITEIRTVEQNRKMWPMLTDIANQVQWPVNGVMVQMSPEDWKHVLSAGFKKEQRVAAGIDGGYVILGQRTSKYTKEEMSDFIELIYCFGANREPAVKWSEPEPA